MKLYLAGPMTGYEDYNFPAFDTAELELLAQGHEIISPAQMDRDAGFDPSTPDANSDVPTYATAMRRDVAALLDVDGIALLPGWRTSKGATFEVSVGEMLGLKIFVYVDGAISPYCEELDGEKGTNPKDLIGLKKPPLRLVPSSALIYMSRVFGLGAKKYGPYNWRDNKVRRTIYLEAAMRHILQSLDGEDLDPESGMPHEAHAASCMAIVLDAMTNGTLVDDRSTPGAAAALIRELTEA